MWLHLNSNISLLDFGKGYFRFPHPTFPPCIIKIIMTLSSFVELISHLPSPFANLKRLKIYPEYVTPEAEDQTKPEVDMPTEVKNYLLDSSPGATFTMVSPEVSFCLPYFLLIALITQSLIQVNYHFILKISFSIGAYSD
ncbi:hypothetical protein Hanom_Chr17g01530951 [Helianthus anomalus]